MRDQVDQALRQAYAVPENRLVLVNCGLAAFVAISHGGALLVATSKGAAELPEIRAMASLSLPLCALLLVTAIAALIRWAEPRRVLKIHAGIVAVSSIGVAFWSLNLLFSGVTAENFVWMPGILTAWVTYAAILVARFLIPHRASAYHLPAFVFAAIALVDLGVLARVL